MSAVPRAAAIWGLLGLRGAAIALAPLGTLPRFSLIEAGPEGGRRVHVRFGAAILAFMGGCLWGFSSGGRVPGLLLLAGPALAAFIAFLSLASEPALACICLAFGFAVLLGLGFAGARAGTAPDYWLSLRLPLTAVVMACLIVGALHG